MAVSPLIWVYLLTCWATPAFATTSPISTVTFTTSQSFARLVGYEVGSRTKCVYISVIYFFDK